MTEVLAPLAAPLRLIHALVGILLVAGLLGRWVALARVEGAAREGDLSAVRALLGASTVFERIVIPSFGAALVLGLFTAWIQGSPLFGFLQGSGSNWLLVSLVLFLSTIPLTPFVFQPRGRRFGTSLDEAITLGRITPGLVAALHDPITRAAHAYEFAAVVLVLVLMLSKPF